MEKAGRGGRGRAGENDVVRGVTVQLRRKSPPVKDYGPWQSRDIMPGGEGSPINLLDDHRHRHHRASTASATDECANGDDARTAAASNITGATFTSTMTSALAGDGLRRRKVIHAAKETFDKGESSEGETPGVFFSLSSLRRGTIARAFEPPHTKPRATREPCHRATGYQPPGRLTPDCRLSFGSARISGSISLPPFAT